MMRAQISEPIPHWGQPPSTVTRWFVFITDFMIASSSIGRRVRKLMTCRQNQEASWEVFTNNHTFRGRISRRQLRQMPWLLQPLPWSPLNLASIGGIIMPYPFYRLPWWSPLSTSEFIYRQQGLYYRKQFNTVPKGGGTLFLHFFSHPLRRCNLSNESKCIVCRDATLEFLNLPWCSSTVIGIAVVSSWTKGFPRQ